MKPLPDSVEANRLGCSCPAGKSGVHDQRGEGKVVDGVREWTISQTCKLHSKPSFWLSTKGKGS